MCIDNVPRYIELFVAYLVEGMLLHNLSTVSIGADPDWDIWRQICKNKSQQSVN
jgi:hypothetical protein